MRIGVFQTRFTGVGGAETVIARTIRELPHHHWTLYVLSYDQATVERYYPEMRGVPVIRIPSGGRPRWPSTLLRPEVDDLLAVRAFRAYLRSHPPDEDLVVAHLPFSTVLSRLSDRPSLWYCHCYAKYLHEEWVQKEIEGVLGPTPLWARVLRSYLRGVEGEAARSFGKILCNSAHTRGKLRSAFGVEAEVCFPGTDPPAAVSPPSGTTFLIPSRLVHYKRADVAVRAMALLRDVPEARLRIVGDGPFKETLRTLAASLGLATVEFADFAEDVGAEYDRALAVLYLPRDEDFGIVPVEAMAHGRPVIAADDGGLRETVIDGVTGYLVPPTPEEVAGRMRALLADRALTATMGWKGRERAGDFTWKRFARQFDETVREVAR
jgi:glycosyltransferase involved in cell wall biosynthesis